MTICDRCKIRLKEKHRLSVYWNAVSTGVHIPNVEAETCKDCRAILERMIKFTVQMWELKEDVSCKRQDADS